MELKNIGFIVVVDVDGVIADAAVEVLASNEISIQRQEAFAQEFPQAIKGLKLSELAPIDIVGGSPLTTKAFNEALGDLKSQI